MLPCCLSPQKKKLPVTILPVTSHFLTNASQKLPVTTRARACTCLSPHVIPTGDFVIPTHQFAEFVFYKVTRLNDKADMQGLASTFVVQAVAKKNKPKTHSSYHENQGQ